MNLTYFFISLVFIVFIVLIGLTNYMVRRAKNENKPHPFYENIQTIMINKSNIKYVKKGRGKQMIMIHGSQMNAYDWRDNIDYFSKNYTVFAIDMIGCGWSDKPKGTYSPEYFAEFINDFMVKIGIDSAIFVASSWGGGHVLHFVLKYPERASALVLSSPCGYKHKPNAMDLLRIPVMGNIILLFVSKGMVRSQLKTAYLNRIHVTTDLVKSIYFPFLKQGFIKSTLSSYKNANFHYVRNNIGKIKLPVLLIWGLNDKIHPIEMAEKMESEIKGAQLMIFEECGHLPHSEKPDLFNFHTEQFLENIEQ